MPNSASSSNISCMTVSFLNVCSIQRKVTEVQHFLASRAIHVFGMAETWLKPSISDGELIIPHYKLYRKDRVAQHGGGVGIYCHESVQVRRRVDLERPDLELLWIDIGSGDRTIRLGCGYRPPNKPTTYWDGFEENLQTASEGRQSATILIGDFNADFSAPASANATSLYNIATRLSLVNYVSSPTRVTSRSASMIDLVFSTSAIEGPCETVHVDISDHHAVLARIPHVICCRKKSGERRTRRLHRVNWEAFRNDVEEAWQGSNMSCIDFAADVFIDGITSVLDKHAPVVTQRRRERRPCPWLTDELVACVRARNSAHRRLMKDRTNEALRQQHREARAAARRLDRKLKNLYFVRQCETSDQRKLWSVINDVTGRRKQRQDVQAPIWSTEYSSSTIRPAAVSVLYLLQTGISA